MRERGRSRRARVVTAAGISAAVVVAGGGAVSYATSQNTATPYVTATAGSHSVLQSLQATGTTEPSSAATVSFAVSGTVASVPVTMGQKVTAGQVLATLDSTALKYALATAQGQVANDNLTLVQAESGQVSAASGAGSKTGTTGAGSATATGSSTGAGGATAANTGTGSTKNSSTGMGATTGGSGSTHSGSGSTAPITAAQKTLLTTVRQADVLLAKTKADLRLATTLCTTQPTTPPSTPTPTAPPTSTPTTPPTTATPTTATPTTLTPAASAAPTTTPPPTSTPTSGKATLAPAALTTALSAVQNVSFSTTATGPTTCIQDQQLVLRDESQLLTVQQGLSTQESALDKLITKATTSTGASTGKASTGTAPIAAAPAGISSTGTSSAGKTATTGTATGGTGATTAAVSAAQLAADQSAVDAANANLALAEQQLSQATIVSPFTGVVSSVGLTVGQEATAGSATSAVDVIDPTGHGVTLSVDVTKIPQVKVGDKATVVPDGSSLSLPATVSYVAAAPTTAGSTAYNVQLAFTSNPTALRDGLQAAVTITTSQAVNALAVPTSAVKHRGSLSYVLLPNGATTRAQIVTVGSVGSIYTQVTGGLTTGQRIVLADPNTPIPTSTITGRIARITGGVASGTAGVLGGSTGSTGGGTGAAGTTGTRTGG